MKDFFKGKLITGLVVIATIILAGVAVFTALRLYQLRQESVSPASPESEPSACGPGGCNPQVTHCTSLAFTLIQNTPTVTSTITPTEMPTLTPTDKPEVTATSTPTPTDKPLGGTSPTPTPTSTPESTSTPTPTTGQLTQASPTPGGSTLPDAGISGPTIFGLSLGFLLIVGALLLAL